MGWPDHILGLTDVYKSLVQLNQVVKFTEINVAFIEKFLLRLHKSFINIKNRKGPKTEPCGMPLCNRLLLTCSVATIEHTEVCIGNFESSQSLFHIPVLLKVFQ